MTNEVSRRRLLSAIAVLSGVSAGCLALDDGPSDGRTGVQPWADDISGFYVERSASDLPADPDPAALAVTGEGIFQYRQSGGNWRPIQYGSTESPALDVTAATASVGTSPTNRPLISNGDRTVYVDPDGGDDSATGAQDDPLATIQEAVRRAPIYLRHRFVVDLATVPDTPVTYDEDVLVPTVIGSGMATQEDGAPEPGPFLNLEIRGEPNDPSAVRIGSVMFGNVIGTSAGNLFHVTITRNSPYDGEQSALTAYGTGEVHLYGIDFTDGPQNGILAYGAKMKASLVDLGDRNVNIGIRGKRHASIIADRSSGVTRNKSYLAVSNSRIAIKEGETLTGDPTYDTRLGGLIHDENTGTWYGGPGNRSSDRQDAAAPSRSGARVAADHPSDAEPGEVYYVDGSGQVEEGFYGRTADGSIRFD